ncbi:MAG: FHA domain-containing protein [Planctomycetaceae bacterium]|nr:FHA domain-containing protein [Planctomycetaceae bacterium]
MAWQLIPEAADRQPVLIDKAIIFFGRHPECDVVITSSRKVSRKHCCVAQVDGKLVVRDLGSMNGIRVNDKTVRREAPLRLGDTFTVGDVVFRLAEAPAKGKPNVPRKTPEVPQIVKSPREVSQDLPVVIPEQDGSFAVEESVRRRGSDRPESSVILSAADIVDDDRDSWFDAPVRDDA